MLVTARFDKKTIRQLACWFFFKSEVLYKQLYDNVLLRSVDEHKVDERMLEVQKEQVAHTRVHILAGKDTSAGLLVVY